MCVWCKVCTACNQHPDKEKKQRFQPPEDASQFYPVTTLSGMALRCLLTSQVSLPASCMMWLLLFLLCSRSPSPCLMCQHGFPLSSRAVLHGTRGFVFPCTLATCIFWPLQTVLQLKCWHMACGISRCLCTYVVVCHLTARMHPEKCVVG